MFLCIYVFNQTIAVKKEAVLLTLDAQPTSIKT